MRKIKIICEKAYAESIWCKQLVNGLVKELKKRRIGYEQNDTISKGERVFIIGMSTAWMELTVAKCNKEGCVPVVLGTQSARTANGEYHLICPDTVGIAEALKAAFENAGRKRIALYGASQTVDLDKDRTDIFSGFVSEGQDIFRNNGNLEYCFRSFLPKACRYDGVICVNGYAAISLVKKLEKENEDVLRNLVIISCEEVLRHSKYNRWISFVDMRLEAYGTMALSVMELAEQSGDTGVITIQMKGSVCDIPKKLSENGNLTVLEEQHSEDPEIVCMARIEQLMREADDMDHHIIAMLLSNAKYGEIADSCYMTEGNIKYRVKKYLSICECKTKKELLELLQEYLQ